MVNVEVVDVLSHDPEVPVGDFVAVEIGWVGRDAGAGVVRVTALTRARRSWCGR